MQQDSLHSARNALVAIGILSLGVVIFLFWLIYFHTPPETDTQMRFDFLPGFNALCNAISATFVAIGIVFIRRGYKRAHGYAMLAATAASAAFLAGYLLHHSLNGDTKFLNEGAIRWLYFAILISHILLSIVVLPMVFSVLYFAATRKWVLHKTLARYTYPVWLYVSITGVLIFIFLRVLNVAPETANVLTP